jgi:hypothetical protein
MYWKSWKTEWRQRQRKAGVKLKERERDGEREREREGERESAAVASTFRAVRSLSHVQESFLMLPSLCDRAENGDQIGSGCRLYWSAILTVLHSTYNSHCIQYWTDLEISKVNASSAQFLGQTTFQFPIRRSFIYWYENGASRNTTVSIPSQTASGGGGGEKKSGNVTSSESTSDRLQIDNKSSQRRGRGCQADNMQNRVDNLQKHLYIIAFKNIWFFDFDTLLWNLSYIYQSNIDLATLVTQSRSGHHQHFALSVRPPPPPFLVFPSITQSLTDAISNVVLPLPPPLPQPLLSSDWPKAATNNNPGFLKTCTHLDKSDMIPQCEVREVV